MHILHRNVIVSTQSWNSFLCSVCNRCYATLNLSILSGFVFFPEKCYSWLVIGGLSNGRRWIIMLIVPWFRSEWGGILIIGFFRKFFGFFWFRWKRLVLSIFPKFLIHGGAWYFLNLYFHGIPSIFLVFEFSGDAWYFQLFLIFLCMFKKLIFIKFLKRLLIYFHSMMDGGAWYIFEIWNGDAWCFILLLSWDFSKTPFILIIWFWWRRLVLSIFSNFS